MESIIYVGMDVHKESYSLCCYDPRTDRYMYEHKMKSTTQNVLKYLENVKKQLGEVTFICGYEAGPTGFGLCRDLLRKDIACIVMAPTSLKRSANYKVKNDRVDAKLLAFLLRHGKHFDKGRSWTTEHRKWLQTLTFDEPYLQEAFDEYMISVNNIEGRLKRIERQLEEITQVKDQTGRKRSKSD